MKKLSSVLLSLVIGLSLSYYIFLKRPLPQRSGDLKLPGIKQPVDVKFDEYGVAHIKTEKETDAFYSLGFIVAQHRLFQMDIQRRIATGRLSEILGEKTLELDKLNRNLGFSHYGKKLAIQKNWDKEATLLIDSFLEGVNHCVSTCSLPVEFKLLNYKPDPFAISDIIAFIGYMSFGFQEAFDIDPIMTNLRSSLPENKFEELIHAYEDNGPSIDKSLSKKSRKNAKNSQPDIQFQFSSDLMAALEQNETYGFQLDGSNSWVISGKISKTGKPILANDPHIRHSNPNTWFEASIKTDNVEIYGHFLPLIPFPILGNTAHHAWALTMSEIDDMDLYTHKINEETILTSKGSSPILNTTEEIYIKNKEPVLFPLRTSAFGPFLNHFLLTGADAVSVYWPFYSDTNSSIEALYRMYKAENLQDFQSALSKLTGPGLAISYVDIEDNIAWFTSGVSYKRKLDDTGLFVKNSLYDEALKARDFSENPHLINPPDHIIITANHRISNLDIDKFPGYYQPSDRARRISQMLENKSLLSVKDFEFAIHDIKDDLWPKVKNIFIQNLEKSNHPSAIEILPSLIEWEATADANSKEYLIYRVWLNYISFFALEDEIGADSYKKFYKSSYRYNFTKKILLSENSDWWDDVNTDAVENRDDIISKAFNKSIDFISSQLGPSMETWSWGQLHTLELIHPLGRMKPLNYIFNIGPEPVDGAYMIVNANAARTNGESYTVDSGPSTRRIIDMAEPRKFLGILPSGNSGHIADSHYKDQWKMYLQGKLRSATLDFENTPAVSELQISPGKE